MQHMVHVVKPGGGWHSRAVPLVGLMMGDLETVAIVPDVGNGNRLKEMPLNEVTLCDDRCFTCPPEKRAKQPVELPPMQLGRTGRTPSDSHPRANTGTPIGPAWTQNRNLR